ncbi:hypothetical protein ANCDUO_09763 [Ancylostoma duodenale]|uniref:Uncharacterized protein n=1 Tax=Ancylostoma duodenale TaxID=51022 RepID=A0A0C2DC28_9BILA|nr:hypothetical protein ANCDUO_09763 [Ancylostoma duodenale]
MRSGRDTSSDSVEDEKFLCRKTGKRSISHCTSDQYKCSSGECIPKVRPSQYRPTIQRDLVDLGRTLRPEIRLC